MTATSSWPDVALPEAVDFLDSQRRPVKVGDRAKMRGNIPYYGASGIVDYVNDYLFDEELILLGEDGENILSRVSPLAFRISGKSWVNNHAHVLRPKTEFDIHFLTAYLESLDYTGLNTGTAQPKLNKQSCSTIRVIKPPLAQQRRIALALCDADDLIAALGRMIAKKQAIKQGVTQQLVTGRTRLPGFTRTWQEASMSEVAIIDPEALTASTDPRVLIDYISLEDVDRGQILGHTRLRFGSAPSRARRVIKSGDVLFGTVRPNLQSHAIYRAGLQRPIASTGFAVVRAVKERSDAQFLFHLLMSRLTDVQVERIIAGSNYPAVSSGDIRRLSFSFPPLEEQRAIGSVLTDFNEDISSLKRRLVKAQAIKEGMMQQLLTGRTRLPLNEAVA
jgi:type I restriction enzyme, S subunit